MNETYLNLYLLRSSLLLLSYLLVLVLSFILEINPDTKGVPELVHASTLSTDDAPNILAVNFELCILQAEVSENIRCADREQHT